MQNTKKEKKENKEEESKDALKACILKSKKLAARTGCKILMISMPKMRSFTEHPIYGNTGGGTVV